MAEHNPVLMYQRSENTCTDPLINHANRLHINLRSKDLFQAPTSRHGRLRRGSPRPYSSQHPLLSQVYSRAGSAQGTRSGYHPSPTYIHNVVIPLKSSARTNSSPNPTTYMSYSQSGGGAVYSRKGSVLSYIRSIQSQSRINSATFDRYSTSSSRERSAVSRQGVFTGSGQMLRYQMEQDDRNKCRTRKRTAQFRPHRVDRMYFMSGTPIPIEPKYRVEDEELQRLRELSRARKKASYYGRGLSKYQYMGLPTETLLPKLEDFSPEEHHEVRRQMLEEHIMEMQRNIKSPFNVLESIERTLWETPRTTSHHGYEDHLRPYSPSSPLTIYNMEFSPDMAVPTNTAVQTPGTTNPTPGCGIVGNSTCTPGRLTPGSMKDRESLIEEGSLDMRVSCKSCSPFKARPRIQRWPPPSPTIGADLPLYNCGH